MTSRSAKYRQRLKQSDPDKYAKYLKDQKARSQARRDHIRKELNKKTPDKLIMEKKAVELHFSRQRQQRYRQKKKELIENGEAPLIVKISSKKRPKTRKSIDEQREYWRAAKLKEKSRWTQQKKTWIRRKDRERKQKKRQTNKERGQTETVTTCKESTSFTSKKREWNVTSQVRSTLPRTPEKFAKVVKNIVQRATPRKRKALGDMVVALSPNLLHLEPGVKRSIRKTSQGKSALKVIAAKLLQKASKRHVSKATGLDRKTVRLLQQTGLQRRRRSDRVDSKQIQQFYCREDVSRIMPQKRFAVKAGPGYLMQVSLKAAYKVFLAENPSVKIGFSKFASLRPRNVRLLSNTHREFCLCVYCVNVRFKLLTLSRLSNDKDNKITNECEMPSVLLCQKSDNARFHSFECVQGNCNRCHDHEGTLRSYFSFALETEKSVTWNHWERSEVNGKNRRILVTKTGSTKELMDEFVGDILKPSFGTTFIYHIFVANWQYMQYNKIKENLPEGYTLSVMDFAKNRTVCYQDEIKSAFFGAQQITLHPIVSYYRKNDQIIRNALIIISNDINHDFHAVQHFSRLAKDDLTEKIGKKPVQYIIFSDGCGCQYKSRGPFADLSLTAENVNRNYYGSEHGKGEGDGETGILNRAVDRAIVGRQVVINDAKDLYNWCKDKLLMDEPVTKRSFAYVDTKEINRDRPLTSVKSVPGTRKIHQAMAVVNKPFTIRSRHLSCFCNSCLFDNGKECANRTYVSPLKTLVLQRVMDPVSVDEPEDERVKPSDFVWVQCETEKGRKFHYVAQVTNVPEVGPQNGVTVTYLIQPYSSQPDMWTWGENPAEYYIEMHQVECILQEPETIVNRSGAIYFKFDEILKF